MDIFGLGEGFSNETFNNLALNEMRAEKDAKLDQLFNMGSGLKIFDYMEAANLLLTRTYLEIVDGSKSKLIFIPETFLPPTLLEWILFATKLEMSKSPVLRKDSVRFQK